MATNPTSGSSLFRFPPHNVSQQPKTSEEIKLKGYQQWGQFAKAFVAVSGSILLFGFPLASKTVRDKLAIWWNEFRTGTRKVTIVTSSNTTASIEAAKTAGQLLTGKTQSPPSDIRTSVNKVEAIKTELTTAAPSTVKSRAGELTPENLAEHMQQIVSGYYAQPFPHRDQVTVEHQGQEVLWKSLSPQEKFDVVYEHSLPHNKPKLMKRDQFSSDAAWVSHIENRLFRGSHNADGTPAFDPGLMHDPRLSHGSDHGMRVGIFSGVYAYLYNKYDPAVELKPEETLIIAIAGGFHDSGRQTEGVDVDDQRSARNAKSNLKKWGVAQEYIDKSVNAIADKDNPNLGSKHVVAKSVQCADSTEYGRVGAFDPKYLDIYKEFNGGKSLKEGRTLEEFNAELDALTKEMDLLMKETSGYEARQKFSTPGTNYYSEIITVATSNPNKYPRLNVILDKMQMSGKQKPALTIHPTTTSAINLAKGETLAESQTTSPILEKEGQLFPGMLTNVKVVNASIGGTTGAKLVKDEEGRKFVQKMTGEKIKPDHIRSEYHTNKAYKALGVKVPEVMLYSRTTSEQVQMGKEASSGDHPVMLSRFIPGNTQELRQYLGESDVYHAKNAAHLAEVQKLLQKDFVADCLLANWDVIGLEFDNIRIDVDTKEVWRVDNGSGLEYRAQGELKGQRFQPAVGELDTLRDPKLNPQAALIFSTITDAEIIRQIDDILPKREVFLAAIPDHLKEIMAKRFDSLAAYRNRILELAD